MNHLPHGWGRPRDDIYGAYDASLLQSTPTTHTKQPIVTGTSVVAVKFNGGVVIAADKIASYGSLARYDNVDRLLQVGTHTVVGAGGDISDLQYIHSVLDQLLVKESYTQDNISLHAPQIHSYLARLMYARRSKFDPLWNALLTAGVDPKTNEVFLSFADLLGTTYTAPALATGFGAQLAIPILRRYVPDEESVKELTESKALEIMDECLKALWYRDARAGMKYNIAVITAAGVQQSEKTIENQNWKFAENIRGYGAVIS